MKKLWAFVIIGYSFVVIADHVDLSSHTKCAFAQQRLNMSRAHLHMAQQKLSFFPHYGMSDAPKIKARILELQEEIRELETCIPVMEKSLNALYKTIQ